MPSPLNQPFLFQNHGSRDLSTEGAIIIASIFGSILFMCVVCALLSWCMSSCKKQTTTEPKSNLSQEPIPKGLNTLPHNHATANTFAESIV